jgi:transcriptional regulator with XRE-family HTH domain
MYASDQQTQLRIFLRQWRSRLHPHDVNLPSSGYRRVPGLRSAEVAELARVSPGWYEQFESGKSQRTFSPAFVQRVAAALRLNDQEQATLFRLALPEVASATRIVEQSTHAGVTRLLAQTRDFARRLGAANSYEEAVNAAVEAAQAIVEPSCATVASVESGLARLRMFAAGPRAGYVGRALLRCMLDMNAETRNGAVVLCEHSPHPNAVGENADHPVRLELFDGIQTAGAHRIDGATYRLYNRDLLLRSEIVAGLFENGAYRGVLSCSWKEPRVHLPIEIATIQTLVAMVTLVAGPFDNGPI